MCLNSFTIFKVEHSDKFYKNQIELFSLTCAELMLSAQVVGYFELPMDNVRYATFF